MNRKFLNVNIIKFAEVEPFHNDNAMMARWQEGESLVPRRNADFFKKTFFPVDIIFHFALYSTPYSAPGFQEDQRSFLFVLFFYLVAIILYVSLFLFSQETGQKLQLEGTFGLPCQELQLTSPWHFLSNNYIRRPSKIPIPGHHILNSPKPQPKGSRRTAGGCLVGCLMGWWGRKMKEKKNIWFWGPKFLILFFILKKWQPRKTTLMKTQNFFLRATIYNHFWAKITNFETMSFKFLTDPL